MTVDAAPEGEPERARAARARGHCRDAATPALREALRERVRRGPAEFRVLVPNPAPAQWHAFHPGRRDAVQAAERRLMRALPRIQDAADAAVRGRVSGRHDPMAAIEAMLHAEPFDEILVALAPHRLERLQHDVLFGSLVFAGLVLLAGAVTIGGALNGALRPLTQMTASAEQ